MTRTFSAPTRLTIGLGTLSRTGDLIEGLGTTRIALVADQGVAKVGLLEEILQQASIRARIACTCYIEANPSPAAVQFAAQQARDAGADGILAAGGGSGIGAAKAVALLLTNHGPISELEGADRAISPPVSTVAIPTTAGSGSEVSNALVLHDPDLVREIVVRGAGYEPREAVLDGTVLRGLPRIPLVHAALDALSHALEALWAHGHTTFTDSCALHAAAGIFDLLPVAVDGCENGRNRSGSNDHTLQQLLELSSLANLACGNSGLALVHALSSSPAVHLPHGQQNGVLLPRVADVNWASLDDVSKRLVDRLPGLYEQIGFEAQFDPDASVDAEAMIRASQGHAFRINNAQEVTDADLRVLLNRAGARLPATEP